MRNLYKLKKYFARYKKKLLLGILFIILSNIGTVYVPLLLKDSIDALRSTVSTEMLLQYGLMIVGASLFAGFFRFMIRETIIVVSREIEYDLRKDFWEHIQRLPLRYFQNTSTGNIMAHATNDINAVRMFLGPSVMYSIDTTVRLALVLSIMFSLNVSLSLYVLIPLPLLSILVYKVGKVIHDKFTIIQEKYSDLTIMVQESFSGIRVVKSYVREQNEMDRYAENSKDYLKKKMNLVKTQALIMPLLILITGISIIVVIWIGGVKIMNNELTLGEITAFIVYLGILIWPMIAFGWVLNLIQQAEASMKRLNKIFNEPYEIDDSDLTENSIKELQGEVEFKNVSFRYADNLPNILDRINLTIPRGSTLAIMGYT
ncbi:MAG: ABC transporter ATP-binding protein, partial [Ignavibacteriaceae bacterium]|nr:ABC transporter ATP-binding protein [Ignavibacteriaceae bacterium]